MTEITKNIDIIVKELMDGNIAAVPTETVYGLGANALNENAVIKIYETKERPSFNPLIVHVFGFENIYRYAEDVPEKALMLMEKFSPGPISFVLKKKEIIPDIVTAGLDTIAIRFPQHPVLIEVLKQVDFPVSAPSANRSGRVSPTSAEDVMKELNGKIRFILEGGRCSIGIESTVVSFHDDDVTLLRPGYVTKEEIESVVGEIKGYTGNDLISPGLLKHHYAPATEIYLTEDPQKILSLISTEDYGKVAYLDLQKYSDTKEIALNLFSDIRKLDDKGYKFIIAKKVENSGLGSAINDRLEKASSGFVYADSPKGPYGTGKLKFTSKIMPDKIIIDFESTDPDSQESRQEDENKEVSIGDDEKIIIELDKSGDAETPAKALAGDSIRKELLSENISSFYLGNANLSNYYNSEIDFPSGIEKGFNQRINLDLCGSNRMHQEKDRFLNSLLENNKYIIAASGSGNVFLIDRIEGNLKDKLAFTDETFEKTGLVKENTIYINSLHSIYKLHEAASSDRNEYKKLFTCGDNEKFIWSSLNLIGNNLVFIVYDNKKNASLISMNLDNNKIREHKFEVENFVSDTICVTGDLAIFICDGRFFFYDALENLLIHKECNLNIDSYSKLLYLSGRIYFTVAGSQGMELYYFDLSKRDEKVPLNSETKFHIDFQPKFTGIKESYINSLAGMPSDYVNTTSDRSDYVNTGNSYLFIGTLSGWKCFGINGMMIYNFEDSDENRIEAVSKNLLVASKKNKVVFHNLNRFQEAESFTLPSKSGEIVSVRISGNEIFILTTDGIFRSFTNDLMNIHV